ncbi:hypothetical protein [Cypionkella sp.]|uniref:hypothetical protein n=1 Tax=Cypionkella sp. TaxID=2811411 RepID=UPI00261368C9|nr:hypothetical protein [Cypionkella sp.]MDB5664417.1 hypothetical protein [Cypionkella sp.]
MAVQSHSRNIQFLDLVISRKTQHARFPSLAELVPLWDEHSKSNSSLPKEFEKGTVTALIKEVSLDLTSETVTLLIEFSDMDAPDPTFRDHKKKATRHIGKTAGEGNSYSAHLIISTKRQKLPNTYICVLEMVPSISSSRVQVILNDAIRSVCNATKDGRFQFTKPGVSKKALSFVPYVQLHGHPSDQFNRDIEHGTISSLHLFEPQSSQPLAQAAYLKAEQSLIKVKVSKSIPIGKRISTIVSELVPNRKTHPVTRIFIQPEREGRSFHVDIETETGRLISEAYTKFKRISPISPPISSASPDQIVTHFETLMKTELVNAR